MSAVLASLVQYIVKVLIFAAVAWAGITCGKKFRDKKDAAKNEEIRCKRIKKNVPGVL